MNKIIGPARLFAFVGMLFAVGHLKAQDLMDLSIIKENVTTKRASSYRRDGANRDHIPNIKDGEKLVIFDAKGAGIIKHIWFTMSQPPDILNRNDIILRMYWDGAEYPSVESPIGAFFGQGWSEAYNYSSLPLAATPKEGRGLVSYFTMPFAEGAKIEIENQTGGEMRAFFYYIDYEEMDRLPKNAGRFHAWYNREVTQPSGEKENEWEVFGATGLNPTGKENYLIADIRGKGHFVGVNYYVNSPTPMWYGEGDDMIFIDGDTLPTLNGTGTEDYFNTAWCPQEVFLHPYFGYARVNNDVGYLGRTHLYRFHIQDPVYFNKRLKFTIEHGHNNALTLDLSSVAYWYQSEASPVPPIPDKNSRIPKPLINFRQIHKWRDGWRKDRGYDPGLWGNEK